MHVGHVANNIMGYNYVSHITYSYRQMMQWEAHLYYIDVIAMLMLTINYTVKINILAADLAYN